MSSVRLNLLLPGRKFIIRERSLISIPHRQKPAKEPPDYSVVFSIKISSRQKTARLLCCSCSTLQGYPECGDYAAVRRQIGAIYGAFCMSVQNEG